MSQLTTLGCGSPCSGPTSTSERMPRMVRVIGAHVTVRSTAMAASRVRTQTGRRPPGDQDRPSTPHRVLPLGRALRSQAAGGVNKRRVLGPAPVGSLQLGVGSGQRLGLEYSDRALTKQLRPADAPWAGQRIELGNQVVIELDKCLSTGHDMLQHMVMAGPRPSRLPRGLPKSPSSLAALPLLPDASTVSFTPCRRHPGPM